MFLFAVKALGTQSCAKSKWKSSTDHCAISLPEGVAMSPHATGCGSFDAPPMLCRDRTSDEESNCFLKSSPVQRSPYLDRSQSCPAHIRIPVLHFPHHQLECSVTLRALRDHCLAVNAFANSSYLVQGWHNVVCRTVRISFTARQILYHCTRNVARRRAA